MLNIQIANDTIESPSGDFTRRLWIDPAERKVFVAVVQNGAAPIALYERRVTMIGPDLTGCDGELVRAWCERHAGELEAMCDGYTERWDGSNHRGTWTTEARAIDLELHNQLHIELDDLMTEIESEDE